jgi:hypothetical protein
MHTTAFFQADITPPKPRDQAKPITMRTAKNFVPVLWLGFFRPVNMNFIEQSYTDNLGKPAKLRVPVLICPRLHAIRQYKEFQKNITAVPMFGPMAMTISDDLIPEAEGLTQHNFLYIDDFEIIHATRKDPLQYADWLRRCLVWVEGVASRRLRGDAVLRDPAGVELFNSVRVKMPQCELAEEGHQWDAALGGARWRASARLS